MATFNPRSAKSQLAAVQKAAAQRAAQQQAAAQRAAQQAAQERAQRAAQMQRAAQLQQVAQRQAAAQRAAQPQPQLQQIAQLQAAQERAQRAAQLTGGNPSIPRDIGLGTPPPGFTGPKGLPNQPAIGMPMLPRDIGLGGPPAVGFGGTPETGYITPFTPRDIGFGSPPAVGFGGTPETGYITPFTPRDIGLGTPPPGFGGPRGLPSGAPPQQVEPFRPIEGMAGNLVGGFTPPPPNQAGQLIGLSGQPQQYLMEQQRAQQAFDVTQGSSAYPPSFIPGHGVMNAGLGFGQAMGAPAVPQQSPTQAAFMQATQYNPRNQLNMSSNMQQPAQNQSTGFGQSNMFSNMQQSAPMQSNMNSGMGQNLSNAVGQTSANMFGGGPSASATQQPQQGNAPVRSGGIF